MAIPDITAEINAFRDAAYGEEVRSALIQLAQKLHGSITNELADMSAVEAAVMDGIGLGRELV